jgi:Na+/H+ antiporter NhaA
MTLPEFFGCAFLAFGPPTAMFAFTVAHDPIRIIILIAAAFFWLCSLLVSSIVWFVMAKIGIDFTILGLIISVLIQVSKQSIPGLSLTYLMLTNSRKHSVSSSTQFYARPRRGWKKLPTASTSARTNTSWPMFQVWASV